MHNNKPPYYKIRPGETVFRYLLRLRKTVMAMYPYARLHGIRYYFDTEYRRRLSYRRRQKKKDYVRRKRAGSFCNKKVKARLKTSLIERDGQQCNTCKLSLCRNDLTIDHILPLFMNGNSALANLQLLCRPCHKEKEKQDQIRYIHKR
jgi:5-methylcytosine-specific restriction endonuclease McrA